MAKQGIKQFFAFTLAEVLLTLMIIGIVAAMTVPGLLQNTQNQEYVTALKKFYAETNQALQQMAADYGCSGDLACTGVFDSSSLLKEDGSGGSYSSIFDKIGSNLVKYYHTSKICGTSAGCYFYPIKPNYNGTGTALWDLSAAGPYKFLTTDGMSVYISTWGPPTSNCTSNLATAGVTNSPLNKTCAWLHVDVNGFKGPNTAGRDEFTFYITNAGPLLFPVGMADQANNYWRTKSCHTGMVDGGDCSGRIIEEGWQMNY